MSTQCKVGVIGAGQISYQHMSFLAKAATTAGRFSKPISLEAVCDLSQISASSSAQQFGFKYSFTDVDTMLNSLEFDVLHILTPPMSHAPLAEKAIDHGINVIVEKPITPTYKDLASLISNSKFKGVKIFESQNYRFNDSIVDAKSCLRAGEIGTVKEIEIRICLHIANEGSQFADPNLENSIHLMPAGALHDFISHFTYLLLDLSDNAEFSSCAAMWRNISGNQMFTYDSLDAILNGKNNDGNVHGRLRFEPVTFPEGFMVTIRGSNGYIETDLFQPYFKIFKSSSPKMLTPSINYVKNGAGLIKSGLANIGNKVVQKSPYHGLHLMLEKIYQSILDGEKPPISDDDMLNSARLIDRLVSDEASV